MRIRRWFAVGIVVISVVAIVVCVCLNGTTGTGALVPMRSETMTSTNRERTANVDVAKPNPAIAREVFDALTELAQEWRGQDAGRVAVASNKP